MVFVFLQTFLISFIFRSSYQYPAVTGVIINQLADSRLADGTVKKHPRDGLLNTLSF